jgi:Fic family protein
VYIHDREGWTDFKWDTEKVDSLSKRLRFIQGKLHGMMEGARTDTERRLIDTITEDVMNSSRIESEYLNEDRVRSSICRRLGVAYQGKISEREDGVVGMMMDATQNCRSPLTKERLLSWHSLLLGNNRAGRITLGDYRKGTVAVVSGAMGKERIHYIAPEPERVEAEMETFLKWLEEDPTDELVKSAVAHIWFVMIHPFDDGNGRIARAISDMLLARSEGSEMRYYSLSARIYKERKQYYDILERSGLGDGDITEWVEWFLSCTERAVGDSMIAIGSVLEKAEFWRSNSATVMNERQNKMVNMLLDGLQGDLTSSRWAKINHCSQDTAINDIKGLIAKGILIKGTEGGRSTKYVLNTKRPNGQKT